MKNVDSITFILSLLGALAWVPILFVPVFDYFRKMHIVPLDFRILTNAYGVSADKKLKKKGTILILVLNLFIRKTTIFSKKITAKVVLKNGTKLKTELLDFSTLTSNNDDGTKSSFIVPEGQEFNISRTVHADIDNLKYVSFLAENGAFETLEDIKEIELTLYFGKVFRKIVKISYEDFPKFNSVNLLDKYEVQHK